MTRKEVIETLKANYPDACYEQLREAVDMAISALEQPEPKWIPVEERLPEEKDSIFAKFYGPDEWRNGMFRKTSRKVITTCEFEDGTRLVEVNNTCDGEWKTDRYPPRKVIAWRPLPEPYQEKKEVDTDD